MRWVPPSHNEAAIAWVASETLPEALEHAAGYLCDIMDSLNAWIKARGRGPAEMCASMRSGNSAWLRFCKDVAFSQKPTSTGEWASPAEWSWYAVLAQQGPVTRGMMRSMGLSSREINFLTEPDKKSVIPQYIEQGVTYALWPIGTAPRVPHVRVLPRLDPSKRAMRAIEPRPWPVWVYDYAKSARDSS